MAFHLFQDLLVGFGVFLIDWLVLVCGVFLLGFFNLVGFYLVLGFYWEVMPGPDSNNTVCVFS